MDPVMVKGRSVAAVFSLLLAFSSGIADVHAAGTLKGTSPGAVINAGPDAGVQQWRFVTDANGMHLQVGAIPASRKENFARGILRMQYSSPQQTFDHGVEYDLMDGDLELDCNAMTYRPLIGRAYLDGKLVQKAVGEPAEAGVAAPRGGEAEQMITEACSPAQ